VPARKQHSRSVTRRLALALLLGLATAVSPAAAQTGANVLLVINDTSPVSPQIGEYYARKRTVPSGNILHLSAPTAEQISRADYQRYVESPIAAWFGRTGAYDRILYIVLTKGVPLRVAGTSGLDGTVASVDSELTLLYRKMLGAHVPILGRVDNPYFAGDTPVSALKPFTHQAHDIFLVTRLDGFTFDDVVALIDRGSAPTRDGKIVLDQKATVIDRGGDAWLQNAASRLSSLGFEERVRLETTRQVVKDERDVLGYYSWGSNDPANKLRHFNLTFVPGALAAMFVSSDGRTFAEPPAEWKTGGPGAQGPLFAGSPQSLAGDLIRDGVTGIAAHVAEPYLDATVRPDVLFPAYLTGLNLAESFYLGIRFLSWQTVVVGDPLCAPFKVKALAPEEIDPGLDPATELPRLFSARRLQAIAKPGWKAAAVAFIVQAETRLGKNDVTGARQALEQAVVLDRQIDLAHRMLAILYEGAGEPNKAIEQYRATLAVSPNDLTALNNLAYSLAVHGKQPREALPLAERAYRLGGASPGVTDTLGWVHHLLGNDAAAVRFVTEATKQDTGVAEIHLHAAVVFDAVGRQSAAKQELDRALKASPNLAKDDDVIRLQSRLKEPR
jgi:uncharacterized protein (TIGR03790 family)